MAALVLGSAQPRPQSLLTGSGLVALGLGLRFWAFSYLGGAGRTRDPGRPPTSVGSGPYRHMGHPVYLANTAVAAGLLLAARLPPAGAALALGAVGGLYGALAWREQRQLEALEPVATPRHRPAQVARWERSTWLTTGVFIAVLVAKL